MIILFLLSCGDGGSKAIFNEEFIEANPTKKIPFEKLVGFYKLDDDSKKRYRILKNIDLTLAIYPDKKYVANNYINSKNWNLEEKELKNFFYYYSDVDGTSISSPALTNGGISIYFRKKDSAIALYVYTPPIKGQEYGDYLRYIKVE